MYYKNHYFVIDDKFMKQIAFSKLYIQFNLTAIVSSIFLWMMSFCFCSFFGEAFRFPAFVDFHRIAGIGLVSFVLLFEGARLLYYNDAISSEFDLNIEKVIKKHIAVTLFWFVPVVYLHLYAYLLWREGAIFNYIAVGVILLLIGLIIFGRIRLKYLKIRIFDFPVIHIPEPRCVICEVNNSIYELDFEECGDAIILKSRGCFKIYFANRNSRVCKKYKSLKLNGHNIIFKNKKWELSIKTNY